MACQLAFAGQHLAGLQLSLAFVVEDGHDLAALAHEARQREPLAQALDEAAQGYSAELDAVRGRRRHRLAFGPGLSACHEGAMLQRCRQLFGARLQPTRASYMYLDEADHIDFHQDVPGCLVTAAACISGEPPALLLLPPGTEAGHGLARWLVDTPADRLAARCDRVQLVPGRLVMFPGHAVPHALAAHHGAIVLVAMCFAAP